MPEGRKHAASDLGLSPEPAPLPPSLLRVLQIERYPDTTASAASRGARQVTASGNNVGKTTSAN